MNVGESERRCIIACIGHSMTGSMVPISDMVDIFGRDAVLAVAKSMPHGTGGPDVVRRLQAEAK